MGARWGGRIKGRRVNRNRGTSAHKAAQQPRRSFYEELGRLIPNATPFGRQPVARAETVKVKSPEPVGGVANHDAIP